jgi:uncharacterized OsmC-like protein
MSEQRLVNTVRSYSSGTPGRCLNNVGVHHFVIDNAAGPKEEITPADAFLAGISACSVLLVETFAQQAAVPLQRAEATIEGVRLAGDPSRFERITLRFELIGPTQAQAQELVAQFKNR